MIDKFDYAGPACPLSGGEDFYFPAKDVPLGRIPVSRIIDKIDRLFDKNKYDEAGKLLEYWRNEAVQLKDTQGELAMENELIGYYRKQNDKEKGLASVRRALELAEELKQFDFASGATMLVNCATAYKAFGEVEKSLPLYERAEEIYKKFLKSNDSRFGALYNNMALSLAETGDYEKAEKAYFSALAIMSEVENGEAESAITYINLAHFYELFGKTEKIKDCMEKAYNLLQSENLPHNGYYAFVIEKCAPSFGYFGYAEICDNLKQEAAEIYAGN